MTMCNINRMTSEELYILAKYLKSYTTGLDDKELCFRFVPSTIERSIKTDYVNICNIEILPHMVIIYLTDREVSVQEYECNVGQWIRCLRGQKEDKDLQKARNEND